MERLACMHGLTIYAGFQLELFSSFDVIHTYGWFIVGFPWISLSTGTYFEA